MSRTIFRGANLLDGEHPARPNATVVVEGERIASVGFGAAPPPEPGDRVIELAGKTLLPGLVLGHYHATYHDLTLQPVPLGTEKPPAYLAVAAAKNVELALRCGYTGIASAGGPFDIDAQLKLAIEDGLVQGPRLLAGSHALDTVGDYNSARSQWWWEMGNHGGHRWLSGPEEFRRAVRDEIRKGAEIVKLFPAGGHGVADLETTRGLSRDELRAAVEAAHERGKLVRAHCPWKPLILECLDVGVDVIDHGDHLDGEVIARMAREGTFLAPSQLFLVKLLGDAANLANATPAQLAPIRGELENMRKMLPEANAAGVRIVIGDDYGLSFMPHGSYAEELELYVEEFGIPALDVIRWATRHGGELLGRGELGLVAPGRLADLIVVDGDPSSDISVFRDRRQIRAVMKGGHFARDSLESPAA
jgi:imidazolonepropionase-like amidohydrolase